MTLPHRDGEAASFLSASACAPQLHWELMRIEVLTHGSLEVRTQQLNLLQCARIDSGLYHLKGGEST
jgi:hypothetical protein